MINRGRTISLKGFVDWKDVDLGGEFIHGSTTSLMYLVEKLVSEQ